MYANFPEAPTWNLLYELLLWAYLFGRLFEELEQMSLEKRISNYCATPGRTPHIAPSHTRR